MIIMILLSRTIAKTKRNILRIANCIGQTIFCSIISIHIHTSCLLLLLVTYNDVIYSRVKSNRNNIRSMKNDNLLPDTIITFHKNK